jgi:predicted NUDIX family phosphoesterase
MSNSKYDGEEILVVPRPLFEELGAFQGLSTDVGRYMPSLLDPKNNFFMDRAAAEDDPTHKQLIPYSLFRHEGRYLHYVRGKSGGESRLHALGSLGIGGHINPVDAREDHLGQATYMAGVTREIEEELILEGEHPHRVVALLNDDSNAVGQVHLGVVHLFELTSREVSAREDALSDLQFKTLEELRGPLYEQLESWTRFCVDALDEL